MTQKDKPDRIPSFTHQCGKVGFRSRADAKRVARMLQHSGLNAYRCPDTEDWRSDVWHLGHLPKATVAGEQDREQVSARRRIGAEERLRLQRGER